MVIGGCLFGARIDASENCSSLLDSRFRVLDESREVRLCDEYQGQVLLIVNTASKCVYTPQYEGLEALYKKYRERGFTVLGFPSNDFGAQEPGSEGQIKKFCRLTYQVEFPMFEKTHVAKGRASKFYATLANESGEFPAWNFHKYLIDRDGNLAGSFPSQVRPGSDRLQSSIEQLL